MHLGETELPTPAKRLLPSGKKLSSLNGLRALAILPVFFHHMTWAVPHTNRAVGWLAYFLSQGWFGVDLFFALSGFLITGILVDTRVAENYFSGFYARRVLRIFPLYYAVLIGILVAASFIHPYPTQLPVAADRKLYFLFLANWLCLWKGQWGPNVLGHFWSLAVEEQFYLLWPLCVWLVRPGKLKAVAVSLSLLALVIRVVWAMHGGLGQGMTMMTFGRMDALLLGALGAILFRDAAAMGRVRRWLPWISLAMLGGFLAAMALLFGSSELATSFFVQTVGYSMLALGFGALVLYAAVTEGTATWLQRILRHAALTRLGAYSYGFYVFHVPIIGAAKLVILPHLSPGMQQNPWFSLVFIVVLGLITFGISAASYELFEAPILSCKRYFGPRFASSPEIGNSPAPLAEPAELS